MDIQANYDPNLSFDFQTLVFTKDNFLITKEDIEFLSNKKLLKGVDTKFLEDEFHVTILIKTWPSKSQVIIFNNDMLLPQECYEEQLFNTNLINRAQENHGWLGFIFDIANDNKLINLNFWIKS